MSWKKFLAWFYSAIKVKTLNFSTNKRLKRVMLINTDMVSRIPKKKGKEKAKKEEDTVYQLIQHIINRTKVKVVFLTEKPLKHYRMQIRPVLMGTIHDFSNPLFIANVVLHEEDREKAKEYLSKHGTYFDIVVFILQWYFHKYEPLRDIDHLVYMFFKSRFEDKKQNVVSFIVEFFKAETDRRVNFPRDYRSQFSNKSNDIKLLKKI